MDLKVGLAELSGCARLCADCSSVARALCIELLIACTICCVECRKRPCKRRSWCLQRPNETWTRWNKHL